LTWVDGSRNHLHELISSDTIAHPSKEQSGERLLRTLRDLVQR
jgi:hypothetical protein